jgi:Tfp pilus assembly protein PilV
MNKRAVKGFLLIEVLITIVLFMGGVAMVVYYHSMSMHMLHDARKRATAVCVAANCMECCRASGCVPAESRREQSGIVLTWQAKPFVDEQTMHKHELIEFVVRAQWQSHQNEEATYTLTTVMSRAPTHQESFV